VESAFGACALIPRPKGRGKPAVVMPKWSGIGQHVGDEVPEAAFRQNHSCPPRKAHGRASLTGILGHSRFCAVTRDLAHYLGSIVHHSGQARDADAQHWARVHAQATVGVSKTRSPIEARWSKTTPRRCNRHTAARTTAGRLPKGDYDGLPEPSG
jgi:hypothetical protein